MYTKAIIMAGGKGKRLKPLTNITNKHFIPIYNKPMIYYSMSLLIYAGIKEILIMCNKEDIVLYKKILNQVEKKNSIKIHYRSQKKIGGGIAEGLTQNIDFISTSKKILLILGDNFFYGRSFPLQVKKTLNLKSIKSTIFLSEVINPKNYGVAYFHKDKLTKIIEKPNNNKSNMAVTGLYIYNKNIIKFLKKIKPSKRNELEITSVNNTLLNKGLLNYQRIGRGTTWFDLGSFENIYQCSEFVRLIEKRQGLKIADI